MDRLKKIGRILALQGKIQQLAEWRLAVLDRQQSEVSDDRARLFESLNGEAPLHGLFVDAMARRLKILARESDRLARAREVQQRRLQEESLRLKRFERATARAKRASLEEARKRSFALILDGLAKVDDASLP